MVTTPWLTIVVICYVLYLTCSYYLMATTPWLMIVVMLLCSIFDVFLLSYGNNTLIDDCCNVVMFLLFVLYVTCSYYLMATTPWLTIVVMLLCSIFDVFLLSYGNNTFIDDCCNLLCSIFDVFLLAYGNNTLIDDCSNLVMFYIWCVPTILW